MTRDEIIERMRAMVDEMNTLRGEVAMVSDHTYELDNLRARVRELEADKLDLIDIVNKFRAGFDSWNSGGGQEAIDLVLAAADALYRYSREHGGTL